MSDTLRIGWSEASRTAQEIKREWEGLLEALRTTAEKKRRIFKNTLEKDIKYYIHSYLH
jgi:hypothetical protein